MAGASKRYSRERLGSGKETGKEKESGQGRGGEQPTDGSDV